MKGIVLCSGGLDSTLALLELKNNGYEVTPIYIKHRHWAEQGELPTLEDFLSHHKHRNLKELVIISVDLGTYVDGVWGRTIAFVGLVAMWAFTHGNDYEFIAIGNHVGDISPDLKPSTFQGMLNESLRLATKERLKLFSPIQDYDINRIGIELFKSCGVSPNEVYSCYWYPSCGFRNIKDTYRCPGCRRKVIAMKAAGITDAKLLDMPNCTERSYYPENAEESDY